MIITFPRDPPVMMHKIIMFFHVAQRVTDRGLDSQKLKIHVR